MLGGAPTAHDFLPEKSWPGLQESNGNGRHQFQVISSENQQEELLFGRMSSDSLY
jgi:hypothetical protein